MPWVDSASGASSSFFTIYGRGPFAQATIAQNPGATIANGVTWDSGVIVSDGYQVISVGITSAQAGSLVITRYLDREGSIVATTASTTAIVAATPLLVTVDAITDRKVFSSFRITASNTSGSTAAVSFYVLLQSA